MLPYPPSARTAGFHPISDCRSQPSRHPSEPVWDLEDTEGGVLVADVVAGSDAARRGMTNGDIILRVDRDATASPDDVWKAINAERAERREFTMMLVLQKHPRAPGAEWVVLRLHEPAG